MRSSPPATATASAIRARMCSRAIATRGASCFAPMPPGRSCCALRRETSAWTGSAIAQGATGTSPEPLYNPPSAFVRTRRTSMKRVAALAAVLALLAAVPAQGQPYPNKPIRIVVPFAAGGTSDILARAIGPRITEVWNQPVIVENRTGANGNVGADFVAKSAPDGYTMLLSDVGALSINPSVYPDMPFDPAKDFSPIVMVSYSPHVLAVHPSVPVSNVKELIAYAKANPGKMNFANSGTGGAPHLAPRIRRPRGAARTGIQWAYIPYKGGSAANTDVIAGNANVLFNGMLATYPSVKAGRLRGLAVSSARRVPSAPELPTVAETLPGFETGSYQGVLAPAGTPGAIVTKLNAELGRTLNTVEMKEFLAKQGTEVRAGTPDALGAFIVSEKARWAKVVKEAGVKAD